MSQTTRDLLTVHAATAELTETQRHHLLEVARRRHVLEALDGREDPIGLDELAALVAEVERGIDATDSEAVSEVATTLHHVHLPKLVETGVLEYEPSTNRVSP